MHARKHTHTHPYNVAIMRCDDKTMRTARRVPVQFLDTHAHRACVRASVRCPLGVLGPRIENRNRVIAFGRCSRCTHNNMLAENKTAKASDLLTYGRPNANKYINPKHVLRAFQIHTHIIAPNVTSLQTRAEVKVYRSLIRRHSK